MITQEKKLNILFAASEVVPFAKTGGLADVGNALPKALKHLGHHAIVVLPAYKCVFSGGFELEETGIELEIPVGSKLVFGKILKSILPGTDVPVYFIAQDNYFMRDGIYGSGRDYDDNCERFVFYARAVLELIRRLDHPIDVIHCNDWQTGLIPAIVKLENRPIGLDCETAVLMTIHNLAYQGVFWHWDMLLTGLDWRFFNWREMEFYGKLNLLKTGMIYADALSTVSPTYAEEIQTQEHGCGLEEVLRHRKNELKGIINGVDYAVWNPETDSNLIASFNATNWKTEKPKCKAELQQIMNLPNEPNVPLVGIIGRLAEQKGWDLIINMLNAWLPTADVQWAILGTGDAHFEKAISDLVYKYPTKISAQLTFSNELAHKIEAGSDIFLMPSRYEPCGLNQLYSLKYGTVPVVRETGGLKDTVTNANEQAIVDGSSNGFSFAEYSNEAMNDAMHRAILTYTDHKEVWNQIVENGMRQDWSWDHSAAQYVELYQTMIDRLVENVANC